MTATPSPEELNRWAQALAGVARSGLGFTSSRFEAERYEEILEIAAEIYVAAEPSAPSNDADSAAPRHEAEVVRSTWASMVGSGIAGYATPKVAVGAIVGDDAGRLLLIQRSDTGSWLYPTGWADVGYSPSEVVVKEVREETGIDCRVERLVGVIDGLRAGFTRVPLYSLLFYCRATGGELSAHPTECLDVGWFSRDNLPKPLVGYERWGSTAFAHIDGKQLDPMFDQPREPVWRKPAVDDEKR